MRALIAALVVALALSGCDLDSTDGNTGSVGGAAGVEDERVATPPEPADEPGTDAGTDAVTDPRTGSTKADETTPLPRATPRPDREPTSRPRPTPAPRPRHQGKGFRVLEVVDGDTVKVAYHGGVSVRVIGIDTPETVHPSVPIQCWGPAASAAATKLLTGKTVQLVFDPTQGRTDTYGRTLAYLHIPGIGDFGELMIRRGHAIEYTYDNMYRHQNRYRRAEDAAQTANRGLWKHCGGADTPLNAAPSPAEPATEPAPAGGCAPGYHPCAPPYPPDIDCADVDGPINVTGDDPHRLDADGDDSACES